MISYNLPAHRAPAPARQPPIREDKQQHSRVDAADVREHQTPDAEAATLQLSVLILSKLNISTRGAQNPESWLILT